MLVISRKPVVQCSECLAVTVGCPHSAALQRVAHHDLDGDQESAYSRSLPEHEPSSTFGTDFVRGVEEQTYETSQ